MAPRNPKHRPFAMRFRPYVLAWSIAACFTASAVFALPTGGQVMSGSAQISQVGNKLTVTNTPGAIINWSNFSVGALETVRFQQQSSLSSVLNRVTGTTRSDIQGALLSNGRVYLINPNGILFGPNSTVNVRGLIASTLDLSDQDFRDGKLNFTAGAQAGALQNAGAITAGQNIYLIAPDIENSGILRAPNGEILLAAGRQVTLVDGAHPDIQIVISAPTDRAVNLGDLAAGRVSVFGALLQQKGSASADRAERDEQGRIVFRATQQLDIEAGSRTTANGKTGGEIVLQTTAGDTYVKGTVEATGSSGTGGTISALGQRVAVMDNASLDASGETGGGRILVGGDYQGKNADIQNSTVTYFGPEATLKANAVTKGDGGTVIVWADNTTRAYGSIEAKGGANRGDGGFVEVSGKQYLDYQGRADTSASQGSSGTLLLDPANVTINNVTDDLQGGVFSSSIFSGATNNAVLTWSTINSQTGAVEVRTTGSPGTGGNITVAANGTLAGGVTSLTLLSNNDITIDTAVTLDYNSRDLYLVAGWNNTGTAVSPGFGIITLSAGSSLTGTSGLLELRSGNGIDISGPITTNGTTTLIANTIGISAPIASGALTATANTANISVGGNIISTGTVSLNAFVDININADVKANYIDLFPGLGVGDAVTVAAAKSLTSKTDLDVLGDLVNNGTIHIGDGLTTATLSVIGDFTQSSTGTVSLYRTGTAIDSISITGTGAANLDGKIDIIGSPAAGANQVIITTTGGITDSGMLPVATDTWFTYASGAFNGAITTSVPALVDWVGQASGSWLDMSNWNYYPTATTNVSINGAYTVNLGSGTGYAKDLTCASSCIVNINANGILDVAGNATFNALNLYGNAQLLGDATKALEVTNTFSQANTTSISGFDKIKIVSPGAGITVGNMSSGGPIILKAYGAILQYSGTSLSATGLSAWNNGTGASDIDFSTGTNNFGVFAAKNQAPSGNVKFTSNQTVTSSALNTDTADADAVNGITTTGYAHLKTSKNGTAFNQAANAPIVAPGGLALEGTGTGQSINLLNSANEFSLLAIGLTDATQVEVMQGVNTALAVGVVDGITGITIPNATKLKLVNANTSAAQGLLNLGQTINVGSAGVELSAGKNGITIASPLTAKNITLATDGPISLTGLVKATDYVQMSNRDNSSFTVTATGCVTGSACINPSDFADIEITSSTGGVVFGNKDTHPTTSLTVSNAISASGFAGATKPSFIALISDPAGSVVVNQAVTLDTNGHFVFDVGTISGAGPITATYLAGKTGAGSSTLNLGGNIGIKSFTTLETTPQTFNGIFSSGSLSLVNTGSIDSIGGGYINASSLTLDAASLGTSGTPLATQTGSLDITADANGAYINNSGVLTVSGSATGPITIGNSGNFTVGLLSTSGTVSMTSSSGAVLDGNATSSLNITGSTVTLSAANGIDLDVTATALNASSSAAGTIALRSPGNMPLGTVSTTGPVSLTSGGNITDANAGATNVTGSGVTLSAAGGIGDGNALETQVGTLAANISAPNVGAVEISNTGNLTSASIANYNGNVTLTNAGSITLATGTFKAYGSGNTTTLTATGASSDITLPTLAAVDGATVVVSAGRDVLVNGGTIRSGTGSVYVTAGRDIRVTAVAGYDASIWAASDVWLTVQTGKLYLTSNGATDAAYVASMVPQTVHLDVQGFFTGGYVIDSVEGGASLTSGTNANTGIFSGGIGTVAVLGTNFLVTHAVPTLSQCIANPSLSGCTSVLPSLATCTGAPSTAGCEVILPSLATCTVSPTTAGCSAVLPSLATCTSAPSTAGCEVVLPSLATCISAPSTAGCTAVLPTTAQCTADPSLSGCTAVLPTLATCISSPTTAGCTAILPSLASCTTDPTLAGCSVVLPNLATCTTSPTTAGCSVVLPSVTSCVATPTLPGCSVVLPSLAICTTSPTTAGCSVVLPSLATCSVDPTLAGCSVVLPSVASCVVTPTLPGCSVVLPSLAICTTSPTTAGCSVVLPSLATCSADPTLAGCSVVLPSVASCVVTPTLPGCSVVLPSLAICISVPSTSGCSVILPSVASCVVTPTLPGCSVVLPSLATCTTSPTTAGCSVVLPSVASCVATPTLPGCSVILPSLDICISTPSTVGCSVILPSLTSCISTPTLAGCSAVLPSVTSCTAAPTLPGCSVVLPSLATCISVPSTSGCSVILPTLTSCIAAPTLAGCSAVLPTLAQCTATPTLPGCAVVLPPVVTPTDPIGNQLTCLLDPTACAGGGTTDPGVTNTVKTALENIDNAEKVFTTTISTGLTGSGKVDLALAPAGRGGSGTTSSTTSGGTSGTGGTSSTGGASDTSGASSAGTSGDSGSGGTKTEEKKDEEKKTDTASTDKSGAKSDAPAPKLYCN